MSREPDRDWRQIDRDTEKGLLRAYIRTGADTKGHYSPIKEDRWL